MCEPYNSQTAREMINLLRDEAMMNIDWFHSLSLSRSHSLVQFNLSHHVTCLLMCLDLKTTRTNCKCTLMNSHSTRRCQTKLRMRHRAFSMCCSYWKQSLAFSDWSLESQFQLIWLCRRVFNSVTFDIEIKRVMLANAVRGFVGLIMRQKSIKRRRKMIS
jgi:hypothetical protein